jgi:AraC-like DNA-binding protein
MKKHAPLDLSHPALKQLAIDLPSIGDELMMVDNLPIPPYMHEPFITHRAVAVFFHEGAYDISVQMRRYHVESPCVLVLLDNQTVQLHSVDPQPKATCIVLSQRAIEGLLPNRVDSQGLYRSILDYPVLPLRPEYLPIKDHTLALLRQILRLSEGNPNSLEAAQNLIRTFFFSVPQFKKTPPAAKSHRDEVLFDFLDLLHEHFRRQRNTDFYADCLCLSPKHLSRVVKQASGRTVHDWIDEYVTTEAKALLRSTDLTVRQVADALCFASQPLFTKYFQRTTGLSPSHFKRMMEGGVSLRNKRK